MTHRQRSKNPSVCETCGATYFPFTHTENPRFCSRPCFHQARRQRITIHCAWCKKPFAVVPKRAKTARYCSRSCMTLGCRKRQIIGGYVYVWDRDGKKVSEHRLIAEQMIGRPILPTEHVHHKNEQRGDNRPDNLDVLTKSAHMSLHKRCDQWARKYERCARCGRTDIPHRGHGLCRKCGGHDYHLKRLAKVTR